MRGDRPVGIDALVLLHEADARQAKVINSLLLRRSDGAFDPDEALVRAEPLGQLADAEIGKDRGKLVDRLIAVDDPARLGEDRCHLDVGREHGTIAIENVRPRRGDRIGGSLMRLPQFWMHREIDELAADDAIDERKAKRDEPDAPCALVELRRKQHGKQAAAALRYRGHTGRNFLRELFVGIHHGVSDFPKWADLQG